MKIKINRTIKLSLLVAVAAGFIIGMNLGERNVHAYSGGPPASRTGAPALGAAPVELNCTSTAACHSGTAGTGYERG